MAEAALKGVLGKLSSFIEKEVGLLLFFDQDMKRLASLLTAVKATLEDAEEKQFSDRSIKDWLQKLIHVAHDLDDILDEYAYEELRVEYEGVNCCPLVMVHSSCLSSFHPIHVYSCYKIAKKMKSISGRLDEIAKERKNFHLNETPREKISEFEWRQTGSFITEPRDHGRDKDTKTILDSLIGDADASHCEDLSVYPIVGIGGLGKTTLAQLIFNHEKVVNHFEERIWVCVSEDFSLRRMTKAIIEAAGHDCKYLDLEPLQRRLRDLLQRKRFLLVLDDVWDDDQEHWQRLKSVLTCGAKGASVLVTTRLPKVALIMGTMPPHELSVLSENYCWELFKTRAFGPNEVEQEELVVIGKDIVKKCGGVPLAATALGGLLRFKREVKEWVFVKESNMWNLTHDDNSVMSALRLSYLNLPIKFRQCFAYCAIFPKGERIRKKYLIELWIANGFISSNEVLDAEDVGDSVWNELYLRSFFQDIEIDEFNKITSFKMHDLVHDLAQFVAQDICCITNDHDVTTLPERIHHLSDHRWKWNSSAETINPVLLHKVKSLRTYRESSNTGKLCPSELKCCSLRVLHMAKLGKELSTSIGHLKQLRYLNLSKGDFKTLPESLCTLWNLQILKLDYCIYLEKLPISLVHLKGLQQLSFKCCGSLSSLPPQIGKLNCLRILSSFFVGKERGFHLEELGQLKLKGSLCIKHLAKVKSVEDAKDANMSSKQLKELWLSWDRNEELELQENVEEILELLQPDTQQLQKLSVEGYNGARFPQWISSLYLKFVTFIKLKDCERCSQLPALGKLPSLKTLHIDNMINVKYVYEECYNGGVVFQALQHLTLLNLPNLITLSREDGENMFPRVSILEIGSCPKFLAEEVLLQGFQSLRKLDIRGCDKFNVSAGFQFLMCLQDLTIGGCREVEGLHEALQRMIILKKLMLENLPNLESLPDCFGNLPLLDSLYIFNCPKLRCLPASLSISRLERLWIWGCPPEFATRYERETGEDWPKIAHIPHVEFRVLIGVMTVQKSGYIEIGNYRFPASWLFGDSGVSASYSGSQ